MEENKGANIGIKILCFFIPIVGLILYLSYQSENKLYAKQCGKSALIGVIVAVAMPIITMIFSLMIYIVSSSGKQIDTVTERLQNVEIEQFNSQFTDYEGTNYSSQVKQLIRVVESSNITNEKDDHVDIYVNNQKYTTSTSINSSNKYIVSFKYKSNGKINRVNIDNVNNT